MLTVHSLEDVTRLVTEAVQESAQVEFKRQLPDSGKNDDLAKDLAAMANSGGGVIIYGIAESGGVASSLAPFDTSGTTERITLVASTIDEPPVLQSVHRIQDGDVGFLVVTIAPTQRGPHLIRGQAFGRTAGGNTSLTRRQIGELFARSDGFAAEFGLAIGRPGRVHASILREEHQSRPFGDLKIDVVYYLVVTNDGDTPVHSVSWRWDPDEESVVSYDDPQPIETLHARSSVKAPVLVVVGASATGVRTKWVDTAGHTHEAFWTTSFS